MDIRAVLKVPKEVVLREEAKQQRKRERKKEKKRGRAATLSWLLLKRQCQERCESPSQHCCSY